MARPHRGRRRHPLAVPHHIIDIVPTILQAAGINPPEIVNGIPQKPIEGVSMNYTFGKASSNAPSTRTTQYFEMGCNRGIYHDGWYACTTPWAAPWLLATGKLPDVNDYKWELYNVAVDYSQNHDLKGQVSRETQGAAGVVSDRSREIPGLPLG